MCYLDWANAQRAGIRFLGVSVRMLLKRLAFEPLGRVKKIASAGGRIPVHFRPE